MPRQYGLSKAERLKSKKAIDDLFRQGKSMAVFPVRVIYTIADSPEPGVLMGVSATKKHFRKAVDRNRIKRLLREAYRLQKIDLTDKICSAGKQMHIFFLYTDKTLPVYQTIYHAVGSCLQKLTKKISDNAGTA